MTVFLNLYLVLYFFTLACIQSVLSRVKIDFISTISMPVLFTYVIKFFRLKTLILILFLNLIGLPPFFFFFFKFNFLINLLYKVNFFYAITIFVLFFLNMLYYIQVFLYKNFKHVVSKNVLKIRKKKKGFHENLFFLVYFGLFSVLAVFFISDVYYSLILII